MLGVARHPRRLQTTRLRGNNPQLDRLSNACQPGGSQPSLHRHHELADSRLRGIKPLRLRNQIDLSPVQALGDDLCRHPSPGELLDGRFRCGIEHRLFFRAGNAALDELDAGLARLEHLGAAVDTQVQTARAARPRGELPIDVTHVRPGHDERVHPEPAKRLDHAAQRARISLAVGHCGAIPIKDDGLEPAGQRRRKLGRDRRRRDRQSLPLSRAERATRCHLI